MTAAVAVEARWRFLAVRTRRPGGRGRVKLRAGVSCPGQRRDGPGRAGLGTSAEGSRRGWGAPGRLGVPCLSSGSHGPGHLLSPSLISAVSSGWTLVSRALGRAGTRTRQGSEGLPLARGACSVLAWFGASKTGSWKWVTLHSSTAPQIIHCLETFKEMPAIYWFPLFPKKQIHSISHRQTGPGQHKAFTRTWSRGRWAPGHPAASPSPPQPAAPPEPSTPRPGSKVDKVACRCLLVLGRGVGAALLVWPPPDGAGGRLALAGVGAGMGRARSSLCSLPWPQVGESHPGCLP